ncbi:MAG: DUF1329 domain-containing protein, partial [Nitrosospira sp.]|nr:DUF1329 domain-containing protein [Nitrosospira sp.]
VQAINAVESLDARWGNGPAHTGASASMHRNFLLVLTKPFDVAGIGIFNVQFSDGSPSAGYVYLRSLRRTRRTASGKSWVDPQPQADLLNDDSGGLQGYPAWYKSWKVLGTKYVLVAVTQPDVNYRDQGPVNGAFIDLAHAPHWNMINTEYQPRKVYVIQGIPPDYHPYGKKVLYMDTQYPFFYYGEFYDKNMKLWKLWYTPFAPYWNGDCKGQPGLENFATYAVDFKAKRMTYIKQVFNAHNCDVLDGMQPTVLKRAASGSLLKKFNKMQEHYLSKPPLPQYAEIEKAWVAKHQK